MKDIGLTLGKILGLLFAASVIVFTSGLTLALAQRIIPANDLLQYMCLVLFDGAAIVWFLMFITQAKGTAQWAFAGLGFLVGLIGSIIMAAGELILGQALVAIEDPTKLSWILITTIIVAALSHATLVYLFHFTAPAVKNRIETSQQISKAIEQAHSDARAEIAMHTDELTRPLFESVLFEARQQIAQSTAHHLRAAAKLRVKNDQVLDGVIVPAPIKASRPFVSQQVVEESVKIYQAESDSVDPTL